MAKQHIKCLIGSGVWCRINPTREMDFNTVEPVKQTIKRLFKKKSTCKNCIKSLKAFLPEDKEKE